MWSKWIAASVLGLCVGNAALASHGPAGTAYVYANVVDVQPITRRVLMESPREQCWQEEVVTQRYSPDAAARVAGATVAGGLIGGVIGHQLGNGRDRDALTVVGSLVGSAIANQTAVRNQLSRPGAVVNEALPVQRCEMVTERHWQERVEGYQVTYRYRGQLYTMRSAQHPGRQVQLRVSFAPTGFRF